MEKIALTTTNLSDSINRQEATYYVIDSVVSIRGLNIFPAGSILDFRGGSFEQSPKYSPVAPEINLNGSTVHAASYCIFSKDITVSGFGNSFIKSEWFKDAALAEHEAINRSLTAANGIPVHLEGRTYYLTGAIEFPDCTTSQNPECTISQTLVSPGVLRTQGSINVIQVAQDRINLDINKIEYSAKDSDPSTPRRAGTGILLSGNARYLDIKVNIISWMERGIAVIPGKLSDTSASTSSSIQFCTIRFKMIQYTTYCFYVDIFSKSGLRAGSALGTRFSDSRVFGGRMMGENAIYFVNPDKEESGVTYPDQSESITRLLFENIGLEDLTGIPMYINHVSSSKFLNLRHAESLPGLRDKEWNHSVKWFILNHVSGVTISSKGLLDPMRIDARKDVRNVIFDAFVLDDFGWYINHYDRVVINPGPDGNPQMVATSSVLPYNMAKTIYGTRIPDKISDVAPLSIKDLLPQLEAQSGGQAISNNVLPRTINMIIKKDEIVHIDLMGLDRFGQCVIDILGMVEPGGYLMFSITGGVPRKYITVVENGYEHNVTSVTFNEWGLYRLTFDANWNIVITKITL